MLFPTMTFAVFFVIVLGVSWRLRPRPVAWKVFILASSYLFYGWWDWRFLILLVGSQVANSVMGQSIARATGDDSRRWRVRLGVGLNLALLGVFKYFGFFVDSLVEVLRPLHLAPTVLLIKLTLPIGISFFTFCAISYLIDLGRREIEPASLLDFSVYLSFFPHLIAGPIVRASELIPQLNVIANPNAVDATRGARLIARGLVKKMIVANYLAQSIVTPVFGAPGAYHSIDLIVGAWAFAVQIYADFSGYTDIAIGTALLLGIKFPENFDAPYSAISIRDFWHRWHMTLSRWLRDYLYIPLGGNRGGTMKLYRNLFLTMLLGGLWHGASWTFIVWGAYHGVGLVVERVAMARRLAPHAQKLERSPRLEWLRSELGLESSVGQIPVVAGSEALRVDGGTDTMPVAPGERNPWFARMWVFQFVTVGWIFFRSDSISSVFTYLWRSLMAWGEPELVTPLILLTIAATLACQFIPRRVGLSLEYRASLLPPIAQGLGFAVLLLVIDILGPQGVAPFIYFQF